MNWINESIAIGNYLEAQDVDLLRNEAFGSVLGLEGTLRGRKAAEFGLKDLEVIVLEDGPGNDLRQFEWAVDALTRLVRGAPPVLVHCQAGRSRSAVVVAGYLMNALQITPEEALAQIAAKREIAVTSGLERLLEKLG